MVDTFDSGLVTAETVSQETGDAPDRGYADSCQFVDSSVGQVLLQTLDNLPAIDERLKFCRRTEILKEKPTFLNAIEAVDRCEQGAFSACLLASGFITVRFHLCSTVLTR